MRPSGVTDMHDQSVSRTSGQTLVAVSAMCVRALRIAVLNDAGIPRSRHLSALSNRLDHRPQRAHRHPLGHDRCRRDSQARGGIGRARARRHPGPCRHDRGAVAAGDPHRTGRVPGRRRSGRRRLRRQPGAAGRQRHRFHELRIQPERQMAGTAQTDRAKRDASGGPSECRHSLRPWPVRRRPGHGAVAQRGGEPGQRARRQRDQRVNYFIRAKRRICCCL